MRTAQRKNPNLKNIRNYLYFFINNVEYKISTDIHQTVADFLRKKVFLTGTKIVCAEGDCGACSVLMYKPSEKFIEPFYYPINSCIMSLGQIDGCHLITVDDLAKNNELSEVQKKMLESNSSQCGFCTPGFVVSLTGFCQKLNNQDEISHKSVKNALTGNLCRCTGYESILKAGCAVELKNIPNFSSLQSYRPIYKKISQELKKSLFVQDKENCFYAPTALDQTKSFLNAVKSFKVLGSGTDLGVQKNKNKISYQNILSLQNIKDLKKIKKNKNKITLGARVTIEQFRKFLKKIKAYDCVNYLNIFASPQIKNVATVVGNIVNASPIADVTPLLMSLNGEILIYKSSGKKRCVKLEDFFLGYKKIDLKANEFVYGIKFDSPKLSDFMKLYKTSQRRDLDISAVNCVFRLNCENPKKINLTASVGGCSFKTLRLFDLEKQFNSFSDFERTENIAKAKDIIQNSINPIDDLRGSSKFRQFLVTQYFEHFISEVRKKYQMSLS